MLNATNNEDDKDKENQNQKQSVNDDEKKDMEKFKIHIAKLKAMKEFNSRN